MLWQVCTSAPLLHRSAPHRFGLGSLQLVLLSSTCHPVLSFSRKMGDDRKKRSRSRSRDKKRKDRWSFCGNCWVSMDVSAVGASPLTFVIWFEHQSTPFLVVAVCFVFSRSWLENKPEPHWLLCPLLTVVAMFNVHAIRSKLMSASPGFNASFSFLLTCSDPGRGNGGGAGARRRLSRRLHQRGGFYQ